VPDEYLDNLDSDEVVKQCGREVAFAAAMIKLNRAPRRNTK
jgi:hypothetical protein